MCTHRVTVILSSWYMKMYMHEWTKKTRLKGFKFLSTKSCSWILNLDAKRPLSRRLQTMLKLQACVWILLENHEHPNLRLGLMLLAMHFCIRGSQCMSIWATVWDQHVYSEGYYVISLCKIVICSIMPCYILYISTTCESNKQMSFNDCGKHKIYFEIFR